MYFIIVLIISGLVGFGGNVSAFITPLGRSYVCNQTIDVTVNKTVIELKNFRIEAFRNTTSKDFGSGKLYTFFTFSLIY